MKICDKISLIRKAFQDLRLRDGWKIKLPNSKVSTQATYPQGSWLNNFQQKLKTNLSGTRKRYISTCEHSTY